ncbi:MAG: STAS domain-containing protein [bacterium]|nr:STAS domain-containing protein [bacterium]
MNVEESRNDSVLILSLSGRLDNLAAQEFVRTITQQIESGEQKILIDFSELSYLSSSGLRVLLGVAKRMKKKAGKLSLCSLSGIVRRVVEIAGFDKILTIYADREEALQHFDA